LPSACIGLLGAALLASGVLPLSTSYSLSEAFGFERGVSRTWREAPFFWGLFTTLIVIGTVVAMLPNLPVIQILLNLYLLNGLLLPIILFAILYLVNQKRLMGRYTNGLVYNVVAYTLAIIVSGLAVLYLLTQVFSFFGIQLLGKQERRGVFLRRLKAAVPYARAYGTVFLCDLLSPKVKRRELGRLP
jgi:Mn2+/Fe2+ NRAMP family transporter